MVVESKEERRGQGTEKEDKYRMSKSGERKRGKGKGTSEKKEDKRIKEDKKKHQ